MVVLGDVLILFLVLSLFVLSSSLSIERSINLASMWFDCCIYVVASFLSV